MALKPVEDAIAEIVAAGTAARLSQEIVPVGEADGRILSVALAAKRTQPPTDVSAMDGYGLHAADLDHPGKALALVGESAAGHPFPGTLKPGEAVRIFTGAPIPEGCSAVLVQERADRDGASVSSQLSLKPGANIRRRGQDFMAGDELLPAGTFLDAAALALAASLDCPALHVIRRPKVAVLSTGDELVPPGHPDAANAIIACNAIGVCALARAFGAEARDLGIARDTEDSLREAFAEAARWGADILVTIGGASVGDHDLVRKVVASQSDALAFYKLALRPGKPFNFGKLGAMFYCGLPGNPVSALVCARLFLPPLLRAMRGEPAPARDETEPAILGASMRANDERRDFMRAHLSRDADGRLIATPSANQDSSLLSVLASADCLLIRPPHAPAAEPGEPCRILRLK